MKVLPNVLDRGFFKYQEEFESKALEVLRKRMVYFRRRSKKV